MEAKDTVMAGTELHELWIELNVSTEAIYKIADAQAEISFKAGMEYALTKEGVKEGLDSICRRERQEGRREVAEWIENNLIGGTEHYIALDGKKWQAFKKERRL